MVPRIALSFVNLHCVICQLDAGIFLKENSEILFTTCEH